MLYYTVGAGVREREKMIPLPHGGIRKGLRGGFIYPFLHKRETAKLRGIFF